MSARIATTGRRRPKIAALLALSLPLVAGAAAAEDRDRNTNLIALDGVSAQPLPANELSQIRGSHNPGMANNIAPPGRDGESAVANAHLVVSSLPDHAQGHHPNTSDTPGGDIPTSTNPLLP
jgi:hypothetical protein